MDKFELKYEKWPGKGYSKGYPSWNLYKNDKLTAALSNDSKKKDHVIIRHLEKFSDEKGLGIKLVLMLLKKGVVIETGKPNYNSISTSAYYMNKKINDIVNNNPNYKSTTLGKANNEGKEDEEKYKDVINKSDNYHYKWEKKLVKESINFKRGLDPKISKGDQNSINYLQKKTKQAMGESLHFERGLDPKDSLKIGIRNKRSFKTVRECAQFFIDNIGKLSEGRFKTKEELKEAFNRMDKTKKNPGDVVPAMSSPLRMSKDYLDGFIERDNRGETVNQKYPPIYIEEWGTDFHHKLEKLQGLRDFHVDLQIILGIHNHKEVK